MSPTALHIFGCHVVQCNTGSYSTGGSDTCTQCPAGKNCSDNSQAPIACPAGYYSPFGVEACIQCDPGKYTVPTLLLNSR